MRKIFLSISPEFPKNFRRLPNIAEMLRQLPNIAEDTPMTSDGCRMSRYEARNLGAILIACYLGAVYWNVNRFIDIRGRLLEYFRGN